MSIKKTMPTPIYFQLKKIIENQIEVGKYQPNDKLPTENEFCETYDVSRITVRRALSELESAGKIYRMQGKGIYVSEQKISQDLTTFYSFSDEIVKRGYIPSSIFIGLETIKASSEIAAALSIERDDAVYMLERIRMADNKAIALDKSYFAVSQFEDFSKSYIVNGSLYEAFEKYYNIKSDNAVEEIEAISIIGKEAELMGVPAGSPFLLVKRTSKAKDIPVEFNYRLVNTENYKYRVILD